MERIMYVHYSVADDLYTYVTWDYNRYRVKEKYLPNEVREYMNKCKREELYADFWHTKLRGYMWSDI